MGMQFHYRFPPAVMIAADVDCDPVKPCPRIAFYPPQVVEQSQENLLRGILRVLDASQEAVRRSKHQGLMGSHQFLEILLRLALAWEDRQCKFSGSHYTREYAKRA